MWGPGYGSSLSVQVSIDGGSTWSNNLWSKTNDQGNIWQLASVDLSAYRGQYVKVRFIGVTGSNPYRIDMAVDNIKLDEGSISSSTIVSSSQTWDDFESLCDNLTIQNVAVLTITGSIFMPLNSIITVKSNSELKLMEGSFIILILMLKPEGS